MGLESTLKSACKHGLSGTWKGVKGAWNQGARLLDNKVYGPPEERDRYLGNQPLQRYPTDEYFSMSALSKAIFPFRLILIPEGYAGVRRRIGMVGDIKKHEKSEYNGRNEIDETGKPIRVTSRKLPGGGAIGRGPKLIFNWLGVGSEIAVVDTRLRTENLELADVPLSRGAINANKVHVQYDWRVLDAVRAMNGVEDYAETTRERAETIVRDRLFGRTIEKIAEENEREGIANLFEEKSIILPEAGTEIKGLYLQNISLDEETKKYLSQVVQGRYEAKALLEEARNTNEATKIITELAERMGMEPRQAWMLMQNTPRMDVALSEFPKVIGEMIRKKLID